jgi:uncharacterized protein YbbC (DUF1343 family)/CubicO group peptidase (beta-lactamase class C family)
MTVQRRLRQFYLASATVAALVSGATSASARVAPMPERLEAVSSIVEREIALHHVPGAVVVVGNANRVFYRRAFGDRLLSPEAVPMTSDAIFDLASLTKVVATSTAIMQLSERGLIGLDARVARYWPAFGAHGKDQITIRQLLTHMSGLRPDIEGSASWSGRQRALAQIIADHPVAPPGTRFRYSDINFIVLGELVRRVAGEPLDVYAAKHIFEPLGMRDTMFNPGADKRSRIVPTDIQSAALRWGMVQDPTAYRMGGVAGHAGLFSTADDLSRFAEMLLGHGLRDGVHILNSTTVAEMTEAADLPGDIKRGLGWDIASDSDSGMAQVFGAGSFGHAGYTGTAIWIDPQSGVYLIILASRLYPDDHGDAQPLRMDVATAVTASYRLPGVIPGIDVLERRQFAQLRGMNIGVLTNRTGRDLAGRRTIDVLAHAPDIHLIAIFSPEHGLNDDREGKIASGMDAATGLPVYSLYGAGRRPDASMLAGLDAIVVDLQDAGARFYTYPTTVAYLMEEAAKRQIKVVILDRPNPIAAAGASGPVLEPDFESFTGYFALPVEHGMTLGELATMFNAEKQIGADLTVVPMQSYVPNSWYDETGLSWVNPSPNLRSTTEAILYPGLGLLEGTNLTVGRGTDTPFEILGAPWIDASQLAEYLNARSIPGARFEATQFTPTGDRYAGQLCGGIRIHLTDRNALDAPLLGIEIASALHLLYPADWTMAAMRGALGSQASFDALQNNADPRVIAASWRPAIQNFQIVRARYRLYQPQIPAPATAR